ncbi:MAG: hypothetical protein ABL909_06165 [Sphingopyxis sp.]
MSRVLALILVLMMTSASAQMRNLPARTANLPPPVAQPVAPNSAQPPHLDIANDPERARAEINRLRGNNRQMRQQLSNTLADLQAVRRQIDEMSRAGGSLVTAYCASSTQSRNTAGAVEDCSASGYTCAAVSGMCHRSCTTATMCAQGFACDMDSGRCALPPVAQDD